MLGDLTYEYDKARNRTKIGGSFARTGIPQALSSTAYSAGNQQTSFGDKTLTYDNNGNLLTMTDANGTTTYTWNVRNQLVGISAPNVNATFVYDGLGRREKKTINGNLTEFLYDGLNPVQETSGTTVLANILPGLRIDEFLTRTAIASGATSYFLLDALGSPRRSPMRLAQSRPNTPMSRLEKLALRVLQTPVHINIPAEKMMEQVCTIIAQGIITPSSSGSSLRTRLVLTAVISTSTATLPIIQSTTWIHEDYKKS